MRAVIAALYVQPNGVYADLAGVDPWDEARDARTYAGPWPVVAHPPCARWGRYWGGGPSVKVPRKLGDDDGCFAAALESVRKWGGVLEHPQASHAWDAFGLRKPPFTGGWIRTFCDGWTCCVEQGHYGHLARKQTWLYVVGPEPAPLIWGPSEAKIRMDMGYHTAEERRRAKRGGARERLSAYQRAATPIPFRDLLLGIARNCAMVAPLPTPYAVVDDLDLGISAAGHPFVQTNKEVGLTATEALRLIGLLGATE